MAGAAPASAAARTTRAPTNVAATPAVIPLIASRRLMVTSRSSVVLSTLTGGRSAMGSFARLWHHARRPRTMCGMPRAIVISIDGLAAFYWRDPGVRMPRLRALAERGVVADGMETVFPSTTWPTHVSLVTGVSPVRHGVVGNSILNRVTRRREDL